MAFESMSRVKELQERLLSRMHNMKKKAEKSIGAAIATVEINGGLAGWGYVNERFGDAPADDPGGLKEHAVMKVPTDLAVGLGLIGVSLFGGLGKYEEHGLNLGNASTGAFSYRLGAQAGRKALSESGTKTSGAAQVGPRRGVPAGGRTHHVQYAT